MSEAGKNEPVTYIVQAAEWGGSCDKCHRPYGKGELISMHPKWQNKRHLSCVTGKTNMTPPTLSLLDHESHPDRKTPVSEHAATSGVTANPLAKRDPPAWVTDNDDDWTDLARASMENDYKATHAESSAVKSDATKVEPAKVETKVETTVTTPAVTSTAPAQTDATSYVVDPITGAPMKPKVYGSDYWSKSDSKYDGKGYSYSSYVGLPYTSIKKSSDSHPIDIDYFRPEDVKTEGKLGMTYAPGKTQDKGMTGDHARNLDKDLVRMIDHWGMDVLVTLNEESELKALKIPDLFKEARAYDVETIWVPFEDQTAPVGMKGLHMLVGKIYQRLDSGYNVVIHCKGGLGRTGLVAACVLVYLGFSPKEAIAETRRTRPYTLQTKEQERFVYAYADYCEILRRKK